jgi:hypothetical protein
MPRKTNEGLSSRRGRVLADEDIVEKCAEKESKGCYGTIGRPTTLPERRVFYILQGKQSVESEIGSKLDSCNAGLRVTNQAALR